MSEGRTGYQCIELARRGVRFPVLQKLAERFGVTIAEMAQTICGDSGASGGGASCLDASNAA